MNYKTQERIIIISFLTVPFILMVMFLIYPTIRMLYMSFTNWDGVLPKMDFVGLKNYIYIFKVDKEAWVSLGNNLIYAVSGLIQNVIALLLAMVLTSKIKGRNLFRAVIFLPYILNSVAVSYMFDFMYNYERSPINLILTALNLHSVDFLNGANVNLSLAAVCFWRYAGYSMIIYIAALQSIPQDIYESAQIDGANAAQTLWYITLPNIRTIIELNLFLTLSGSLNAFVEPWIITKGGPGTMSRTFLFTIVKNAFEFSRFSYASALAVVLIFMALTLTWIQKRVVMRGGK
jgi:multiple sugar transport system permease protein